MRRRNIVLLAGSGILLSTAAISKAAAQQATAQDDKVGTAALEEIIVTAQKRDESLQVVPLAVSAVTGDDLARSGIRDLSGIAAAVPNLSVGPQLGVAKIALRGIGLENISAGAEGSIAFQTDGVFQSRSIAALAGFYDVAQVEVLRGPQGTLYGRNATGGSVNITTRGATHDPSGYLDATLGNYSRMSFEGALSGALGSDAVAGRIAFQTNDRDGYGKNTFTGNDIDDLKTRAVRGTLLLTPADSLSIELKADYYKQDDHSGGYHYLGAGGFSAPGVPVTPVGILVGGSVASDIRDISNNADPRNHVELSGISAKVKYAVTDEIELRSITGYRDTSYTADSDLDATDALLAPITQFESGHQVSQELQLAGTYERTNWLAGLYYFHEQNRGGLSVPFNNLIVGFPLPGTFVQGFFGGGEISTDAYAAFGEITHEFIENLRVTVGARYSREEKKNTDRVLFDFLTPYDPATRTYITLPTGKTNWSSPTPRIAVDYRATPDVMYYGSWSKGFKAGTYNLGSGRPPVDPEKVDAFELGVKSMLLDRRLRLNVAGFYYDYKDLQVGKVLNNVLVLENAATARIYGLEVEAQVKLAERFELTANAAWLHARFTDFVSYDPARPYGDGHSVDPLSGLPAWDLAGNALSQSPDFTVFLGAQYEIPSSVGSFTLRGELDWRDKVYYTPFNLDYVGQSANAKFNVFLNWQSSSGRYYASLFMKNLTDKTTVGNSLVGTGLVGYPIIGYMDDPRTYGIRVGVSY